jgi:hypothetical protein
VRNNIWQNILLAWQAGWRVQQQIKGRRISWWRQQALRLALILVLLLLFFFARASSN